MKTKIVAGLVGNPNCGKTTLFNVLTGAKRHVGNWPGVTVEKVVGTMAMGDATCEVVDLPGVYNLGAANRAAEDERVARDYVLSGDADVFINIVDASNLERNLYLTAQLLEMRVPVVMAVNMVDIARRRGIRIDTEKMAAALDCPVVPMVATRRKGITELKSAVKKQAAQRGISSVTPRFDTCVEEAIAALAEEISNADPSRKPMARWYAIKLLEGDESVKYLEQLLPEGTVTSKLAAIEAATGEEADILIADGRFLLAGEVMKSSVSRPREASRTLTDWIDRLVLNRLLGIPIFFLMMYLMFLFTINIGGAFIDFFDIAGGALLVDGAGQALTSASAPDWLVVLAKGIGGGIRTVGTFIPIIGFLYLFLSFLEDSGYMARAAFVMDRAMRAIGLPGKSFVPLIVGFGCNVPAIMATRTLEHRRDRVLTVMMAPFMSCGARLPVYALFAAAFFPGGGQNIVFSLYLVGIGFAVLTGLLLKNTLLKGEASPFVMELPPYHLPTIGTVIRRAAQRLRDFVFRAGRVIVPMVMILSFLNSIGPDGKFGHEDTGESMLSGIGRSITPAFQPMGMRDENWPAAVGIFTGFLAKEAVIGTLNALYTEVGKSSATAGANGNAPAEPEPSLSDKLGEAWATVPANLSGVADSLADPLGIGAAATASVEAGAGDIAAGSPVFGTIVQYFDGAAGAYAYLLLILLYMPCVAAMGAMVREVGGAWTLFSAGWTTALSYGAAVCFYQAATYVRHPAQSAGWIAGCFAFFAIVSLLLWGASSVNRSKPHDSRASA
jgi:ferrous iron transport protein B